MDYPHLFQNDCQYTLYAVVVHSGSAVFGHYTAYVRQRESWSWYHADDSRVNQVPLKFVRLIDCNHEYWHHIA